MTLSRKLLHAIFTLTIIIQIIFLFLFYFKNSILEPYIDYIELWKKIFFIILFLFFITIILYIFEHKKHNKNEGILHDDFVIENFNIDELNKKDILYLSTILNQKYPNKKEIILLIMQLINKKIINLHTYFDGNNYQYIIEKRKTYSNTVNEIENELINYLFKNSDKINLISVIKLIYRNNNTDSIIKKVNNYIEKIITVIPGPFNSIYKLLTVIIGILSLFLGFCMSPIFMLEITQYNALFIPILLGLILIISGFLMIITLRKINYKYQYNNDSYLWICKNILLLNFFLIVANIFMFNIICQFIIFITFIFCLLAIMIKYNTHISLSENDVILKNKLIALKNYLKNMNYLNDKEFGNIITYENYIMYAFLFNITIKINEEFDLLQKELYSAIKTESTLYFKLLNSNI